MSEPTRAGRLLLGKNSGSDRDPAWVEWLANDIRAIEVEARAALLVELRAKVEALPCTIDCREMPNDHPIRRSAVLSLLASEDGTP